MNGCMHVCVHACMDVWIPEEVLNCLCQSSCTELKFYVGNGLPMYSILNQLYGEQSS